MRNLQNWSFNSNWFWFLSVPKQKKKILRHYSVNISLQTNKVVNNYHIPSESTLAWQTVKNQTSPPKQTQSKTIILYSLHTTRFPDLLPLYPTSQSIERNLPQNAIEEEKYWGKYVLTHIPQRELESLVNSHWLQQNLFLFFLNFLLYCTNQSLAQFSNARIYSCLCW